MDVATFLAVARLREMGHAPSTVFLGIGATKGSFSGGTVASGLGAGADPDFAAFSHPFALAPGEAGRPPEFPAVLYNGHLDRWLGQGWLGANFMELVNIENSKIIYRSRSLLRPLYGDLAYKEGLLFPSRWVAWAATSALGLAAAVLRAAPDLLLRLGVLPKPSEGPSKALQESGFFNLHVVAETDDAEGAHSRVHVKGVRGDPVSARWGARGGGPRTDRNKGYRSTAAMAAECAACLASQHPSLPGAGGGVLTPASCFGAAVVEYLKCAGVTFDVT